MDVNSKKNSKELEAQFPETQKTIKKEFLIPFRNRQMNRPIRILAVAGSLREGSYSALAAKMVLDLSKNYGAVTNFLDLHHTKLPIYDPDDSSQNIQEPRHLVEWADAFVLASPDYHGSMSGALKNFLDHFWEEFAGKTFGYICASHEKGLTVMDQMRTAVRQCYGWSLPYGISIDGEQDFNDHGEIINILLNRRLRMLARDLVVYGSLIRGQFLQDIIEDDLSDTFAARYKSLLQEQEALVTES